MSILKPNNKRRYLVDEKPPKGYIKHHYFLHYDSAVKAAQKYKTVIWLPLGSGWKQEENREGLILKLEQLIIQALSSFKPQYYGEGAIGSDGLFNAIRLHLKSKLQTVGTDLTEDEIHAVTSLCADNAIQEGSRLIIANLKKTIQQSLKV
jgi:hypothetical protein